MRRRGLTLARILSDRHDVRLITAYPKFKLSELEPGIVPHTRHVSGPGLAAAGLSRLGAGAFVGRATFAWSDWYDRGAARHARGRDLVHCWSGFFLNTMRRAKLDGAVTVVDRASAHILEQRRLLQEEAELSGGPAPQPPNDLLVDKELQEYEEADYISIPSSFVRRSFLARGFSEDRLIQIPYGADLEEFRKVPKEDDVFRVVHCGGIGVRKGVHYLLQAFQELDLPKSELWLIGHVDDSFKPYLDAHAGPKVKALGSFPQRELYRYYSQASLFCLASIEEGLALVIPQAMACELPIVCSSHTGGEDIVRDGQDGFVVAARDVEAMKEKILWCYQHQEDARQMGQSAAARVRTGFTWHDYADRMEAQYRLITGKV